MSCNLSLYSLIAAFDSAPPMEKIRRLPTGSGVYVFSKLGIGCLYVGRAKNIRRRIAGHHRRFLLKEAGVRLVVVECTNYREAEVWLIQLLRPILNGKAPSFRATGLSPFPVRSAARKTLTLDEAWSELFGANSWMAQ